MAETLTAKEVAAMAGTDGKTFRKFLRENFAAREIATPGQGGRYAFTKKEANALVKAYKAKPVAERKPKAAAPEVIEGDEVEDIEFEDLDDPSDDEVEDIEAEDEDDIEDVEDIDDEDIVEVD